MRFFKNSRNFFRYLPIIKLEQGVRVKRKTLLSIIVSLHLIITSQAIHAQTKSDPFFETLLKIQKPLISSKALSLSVDSQGARLVDVFIKTSNMDKAIELLSSLGGQTRAIISSELLTAEIPYDALEELSSHSDVISFIEAAKPITTKNDIAMQELGGYEVLEGLDMPSGYSGKGVIIGIVDTGIDLGHNDFLDEDGNSRVLFAWDQMSDTGPSPSEISQSYGTECDTEMIADGSCPMRDTEGHGTHIAGTAAGRDETYGGVAPDANIIAVQYKSELILDGYASPVFSTTICEAAYYIFRKAEDLGRPAVVNLSLGTHIGAHDGTSLFEQCLDALVEGSSSRAIVAAAGNEKVSHPLFTGLHAGYNVEGDMGTNFIIKSLAQGNIFYLDIWMAKDSDLSFGIAVREASTGSVIGESSMVKPGEADNGLIDGKKISWQINATETASPLNGKPHVGLTIVLDNSVSNPENYTFDLLVSGSGSFDAWWYPDKSSSSVLFTNQQGDSGRGFIYVPGDNEMNVAIPATAKNIIAVGGYASRTQWDKGSGCCQVSFILHDLLPFSSSGPSADPSYTGQKPEITAPGAMIASARSSDSSSDALLDLSDGEHTLAAGTSMATPFVTGTIALMFSADPNYTFEDARRYIIQSAYSDEFTGAVPNNNWGYGKLDILAAVQTAVLGGPTGNTSSNASLSAPDSGAASSCSMIPGKILGYDMLSILISILCMAAVIWSTRKKIRTLGYQQSAKGTEQKINL